MGSKNGKQVDGFHFFINFLNLMSDLKQQSKEIFPFLSFLQLPPTIFEFQPDIWTFNSLLEGGKLKKALCRNVFKTCVFSDYYYMYIMCIMHIYNIYICIFVCVYV